MPPSHTTRRPVLLAHPGPPEPDGMLWVQASPDVLHQVGPAARFAHPLDLDPAAVHAAAVTVLAGWQRHDESGFSPPWVELLHPDTFSGHKLHVAAATLADAAAATDLIWPTCWQNGLGLKAAAQSATVRRAGKGVTVYLPRRDTLDRDASLVAAALGGYAPAQTVPIPGDHPVDGHLWHRYEFGDVDPGHDVDPYTYRRLYRAAPDPDPPTPATAAAFPPLRPGAAAPAGANPPSDATTAPRRPGPHR